MLATALAVLAALAAGTAAPGPCPTFPGDVAELVPDTATAVVGLDVDAFAETTTGRALLPALRADLELAESLEALEDCGISLERTYALVVARDAGEGRVAIVQARNLGTDASLACLGEELRARTEGGEPWVRGATSCHARLDLAGGSQAFVINDYTIVWATGDLREGVARRLAGTEALALPRSLAPEFARLDRSGHLWLAAQLDDDDRRAIPGRWAADALSITAAVDFSAGVRAVVSVSAPNVTAVANMRELVLAGFADLAERLDEYGVEHRLRERARVGIVDGVVAAELILDERELRSMRGKIGAKIVGRGPV